jgi:hypothetical protein
MGVEAFAQLDQELAEVEGAGDDGRYPDPFGVEPLTHSGQRCQIEAAFGQAESVARIGPKIPERNDRIDIVFDRVGRRQPGGVGPARDLDLVVGPVRTVPGLDAVDLKGSLRKVTLRRRQSGGVPNGTPNSASARSRRRTSLWIILPRRCLTTYTLARVLRVRRTTSPTGNPLSA